MPLKGPLWPRDVPSPPIEEMQSQSLDDRPAVPVGVDGNAVVYETHKRSSKLSVLKVTRKQSDQRREEEAAPQAQSACDEYRSISARPEPFDRSLWGEPCGPSFSVRGRTYLSDRVKVPSQESLFRLITVDILEVTSSLPRGSVCLHSGGRIQPALARKNGVSAPPAFPPFLFCINIRVPHPKPGREYHIVAYFAVDDVSSIDGTGPCPSSKLCRRFFFGNDDGDDTYRDDTFKFVPRIVEGNPLVRKAVGGKPVLMGRKLKQSYIRGDRFMELIIDVGSDKIADKIVKLCLGYAKSIVVDMAVMLEGTDESVLPERIMGAFRLNKIDFKTQRRLVEV